MRVGVQEPGAGVCAPKEENAMKKKNPLGLRVLSAAAVMSIVTSIATPALADVYYIGNGSIDVITEEGKDYVTVKQGDKEYHDTSREIVLKDGTSEYDTTLKEKERPEDKRAEDANNKKQTSAVTTIGETEVTPAEEEPEEEEPTETVEKKSSNEQPKAEPEGETKEQPEEPKAAPAAEEETKEEEQEEEPKEAAGDEQPEESVEETDTEETTDEAAEETDDTEETEDKDAVPDAKDETPTEDAEQKIAKAPVKQQPKTPAEGSEGNPTNNVIRVINNWVENTLNIRLSNVHIYNYGTSGSGFSSAMAVEGTGNTKIELDGKNKLDNSSIGNAAGLRKQGTGTMTITDTTDDTGKEITGKEFDTDKSGSLTAIGSYGAGGAGIGGSATQSTENITIEGFATVEATGGNGAGIGGGMYGDAENITIQGNAHVTAKAGNGAGIGGGSMSSGARSGGSATGIVIRDHAFVNAESTGFGAGIGSGGESFFNDVDVTIGTAGANSTTEDVHVTAKSNHGAAIGSGGDGNSTTIVTIQGHATIDEATSSDGTVIGGNGGGGSDENSSATTTVAIKDNAVITKAHQTDNQANYPAIGGRGMRNVDVTIEGNAYLKEIIGSIGAGFGVKDATVNIRDNVKIGTVRVNDSYMYAIGGYTDGDTYKVTVNIDGGTDGKVQIGTEGGIGGKGSWSGSINGTAVTIGNNVLMKLKQYKYTNRYDRDFYSRYFCVNRTEADVGSAQNPDPENPGLVNTIGADTEIWYTDYTNNLVKIVHGENLCKTESKIEVSRVNPTCEKDGYVEYKCGYEAAKDKGASNPCCDRTWKEVLPATGHSWNEGEVTTPATCTTAGVKTYTCTVCQATKTEKIAPTGHNWGEWTTTKKATCTEKGEETRHCHNNPEHTETRDIAPTGHEKTHVVGKKDPTETEPGYTGDEVCDKCGDVVKKGEVIPATGKMDAENAETLELRVVVPGNTLQDLLFTVRQADGERTYTCKKADATLTGTLETLQYLQANGAETIVFVTNGRVSRFAVADLLALCDEGDVFYLCHTADAEPTLLIIANDHTELLNK